MENLGHTVINGVAQNFADTSDKQMAAVEAMRLQTLEAERAYWMKKALSNVMSAQAVEDSYKGQNDLRSMLLEV